MKRANFYTAVIGAVHRNSLIRAMRDMRESSRLPGGPTFATGRCMTLWIGLWIGIGMVPVGQAQANGLGTSAGWQFGTTSDAANKAGIAATISKERAGNYGPGDTNIDYNVAGNMNNCNLNATAIGNTGTNTQDAPIGSPTLDLGSSVDSGATGNTATNATNGGDGIATNTAGGMVESASGIGDTTTQSPTTSTALNSTQANTGAQLSTVGSVNTEYAVAGVAGTGGNGQANLNATQTTANSDQTSSVQGSSACQFQETSGNLASPINAITTMSNQ